MSKFLITTGLLGSLLAIQAPAFSQDARSSDPNFKHFYMGRQQIQVIDESPLINNTVNGGGAAGAGSAPAAPAALPKASFQSYYQSQPMAPNSLPKVFNGVPPKMPEGPGAMSGKAGKLKPKTAVAKPVYQGAKTYKPYSGYGGPGAGSGAGASAQSSGGSQSSSHVQGSVLHWRSKY